MLLRFDGADRIGAGGWPAANMIHQPSIERALRDALIELMEERGFDGFRGRVMELRSELGIPANLTAMGVEAARLDELTEMALEDPSCGGNPVEMTRENTRALFEAAM